MRMELIACMSPVPAHRVGSLRRINSSIHVSFQALAARFMKARHTQPQVIASRPLVFTMDRGLRDGPLGRFSPRSHPLTSFGFTLR
jgi:hypothetical protein